MALHYIFPIWLMVQDADMGDNLNRGAYILVGRSQCLYTADHACACDNRYVHTDPVISESQYDV